MDWNAAGPWKPVEKLGYRWNVLESKYEGDVIEQKLRPFPDVASWEAWKKKGKRYLRIRITPMTQTRHEIPFHKPEFLREQATPWTKAIFYLGEDDRLTWIGIKRNT